MNKQVRQRVDRCHGPEAAHGGFTLIELMIVVVIIAILAAVAIPAYNNYVYRARRADGKNLLMNIAQAEERYYTTFNHYTDSLTALDFNDPAESEHDYYNATVAVSDVASASSAAFTATAHPENDQIGDKCGDLAITNTGDKTPDASDASRNSNGKCW